MPVLQSEMIVIVGVLSFAIGCLVPLAYSKILHAVKYTGVANLVGIILGLVLSFGLASAGLVYLSTTRGGQPLVIVFSFIAGFAIARWFRGEYRSK
jgi:hypothetical protein